MKWSTGDAPGDYGGPPTTTKLRKYWGQDVDPLTSDDFIWNKDFMGRMKKYVQDSQENDTASRSAPKKVQSFRTNLGLLSYSNSPFGEKQFC